MPNENDSRTESTPTEPNPERTRFSNIIDGVDYTNARFLEVKLQDKDTRSRISNVPETDWFLLYGLTKRTGPGRAYDGLGWADLFAVKTADYKLTWIPIRYANLLSASTPTSVDCMFRLWYCEPGLLHVDVDDDGTWTVEDVLSLPEWMLIG